MKLFRRYLNSIQNIDKKLVDFGNKRYTSFRNSREGQLLKKELFSQQNGYCANLQCHCKTQLPIELLEMDHIKPRSKYPELATDRNNFQLLCSHCNRKKSNQ